MIINEIRNHYTKVVKVNGQYRARLVIDNQSFDICSDRSKGEADWYAEMLAKALEKMLSTHVQPLKDMLRKHQWVSNPVGFDLSCPECLATQGQQHFDYCELAKLIK